MKIVTRMGTAISKSNRSLRINIYVFVYPLSQNVERESGKRAWGIIVEGLQSLRRV